MRDYVYNEAAVGFHCWLQRLAVLWEKAFLAVKSQRVLFIMNQFCYMYKDALQQQQKQWE